ncbi:hypothetical protein ACFV00_15525 [Streptomyces californicus]|uniref:hypothetical protein n=1 Tax=Streptomyces californicus TaxID=67351 RepID=UPI0036817CEC
MSEQLTAEDVVGMTEWQLNEARREGRLDDLLAQLAAPVSSARPFTVPTDPETGRPVPQLGAAAVKALSVSELDAAAKAGKLTAYMAGHDVVPPPPDESAPPPVRASWQFTADHVALMDTDEVARYRAAGQLVDYDAQQAAGEGE